MHLFHFFFFPSSFLLLFMRKGHIYPCLLAPVFLFTRNRAFLLGPYVLGITVIPSSAMGFVAFLPIRLMLIGRPAGTF
jgi:hypothetical protein